MDFSRRLARLRAVQAAPPVVAPAKPAVDPRVVDLKQKLDALIARQQASMLHRPAASPPVDCGPLPGERRRTPHGEVHMVEQFLEPDHHHGRVPIANALGISGHTIAKLALDPSLSSVIPERMLFLDTETTGLAGGAGTLAFLIGLAWFDGRSLTIEQLLLLKPGEEGPMLEVLKDRLRRASCLVTYNGKSYDWPLLASRFVMNRMAVPEVPAHLDLLHCSRRIYKRRLRSVRLVNMEAEVLGFRRVGDIDGSEIPERYWSFVRGAENSILSPVIEHNAHDLVALAAILAAVGERYDTIHRADAALDHLGLAGVAERAGDHRRALRFARAAAEGGEDSVAAEALMLGSRIARRDRDFVTGAAMLHEALERVGADEQFSPAIHLALTKLYEHKLKDLPRALDHAAGAFEAEGEWAHRRRMDRLQRRLARHEGTLTKTKTLR